MEPRTGGAPPGRNGRNGVSCLAAVTTKQPQLISRPDENLPQHLDDGQLRRDLQLAMAAVELALIEHMDWPVGRSYVLCQQDRRDLARKFAGAALLLAPGATEGGGQ